MSATPSTRPAREAEVSIMFLSRTCKCSSWVKSEPTQRRPEELKFEAKEYFRRLQHIPTTPVRSLLMVRSAQCLFSRPPHVFAWGGGGGGGFFLACEDLGRMFNKSFPACAFFFLKWRLARSYSSRQDQSTVARRAETTVTERFLTSVSSFPDRFPHYARTEA